MSTELPLVSIITPAYNRASYLDETLQSVLEQDYPRIEYIVLDDGSKDNTREVLAKYTGRIIWESHANMGEMRTVNKGFEMATGEIVCVVNSDDPLLPGAISAAVEVLRAQPEVIVAYSDWIYIDADSKVLWKVQAPDFDYVYMVRRHHCIVQSGAFIRRKALEAVGLRDTQFRYVGDFDHWLRLGLYGPFVRMPKTFGTFRVHPDSASVKTKGSIMAAEDIRLIKKYYSLPNLPPEILKVKAEAFSRAHYHAALTCQTNYPAALKHYFFYLLYYPPNLLDKDFYRGLYRSFCEPWPIFGLLRRGLGKSRRILGRISRSIFSYS